MAAETPQLKESQPILSPVNVSSGASGHEAFAKTLGNIAEKAAEGAEKIASEQSNAMYLSSLANIDQLKLSAQTLIATDPANSTKYAEIMRDSVDKVQTSAYVNAGDRQKLKRYAGTTTNSVELEAVKKTVHQAQIGAEYEHYKNWQFQLGALRQTAVSGDQAKFDSLKDSMVKQIDNLVSTGAMTPLQGKAAIESMTDAVSLAKDVHDFYQNTDKHSAENLHAVMANPYDPNQTGNINYPADQDSTWAINYHASDRTFTGMQNDLQSHQMPNIQDYENLTPLQRQQLKLEYNGVRRADGLIDSNAPLPKIESRLNELEGKTDYASVAERKNLKGYINDLKSGNSQKLMARTAIGGRIVRDYTDKQSYLSNQLQKTDSSNKDEIANIKAQMAKNKNDYVNKSVAFAEAHHWPTVHPIPKEDVETVRGSFNLGANPQEAIRVLNQYSLQNQVYVAEEMKDPKQKVIVQTISMGGGRVTDQEKMDFIAANQPRAYKEIDLKTNDQITDDYLKNVINTNITGAIKLINAQRNPQEAVALNGKLIEAGVNYAKYISEKKGQFSMSKDGSIFGSINNTGQVVQFINSAYEPMSGANYIVNKKQVDLEKAQMDYVAQYAIENGYEYLRSKTSPTEFSQLQSAAPLTVTVTPTNNLIARDANGNIAYKAPLTSDLVAHAAIEMEKLRKKRIKESSEAFKPLNKKQMILGVEKELQNLQLGESNANAG